MTTDAMKEKYTLRFGSEDYISIFLLSQYVCVALILFVTLCLRSLISLQPHLCVLDCSLSLLLVLYLSEG